MFTAHDPFETAILALAIIGYMQYGSVKGNRTR